MVTTPTFVEVTEVIGKKLLRWGEGVAGGEGGAFSSILSRVKCYSSVIVVLDRMVVRLFQTIKMLCSVIRLCITKLQKRVYFF